MIFNLLNVIHNNPLSSPTQPTIDNGNNHLTIIKKCQPLQPQYMYTLFFNIIHISTHFYFRSLINYLIFDLSNIFTI